MSGKKVLKKRSISSEFWHTQINAKHYDESVGAEPMSCPNCGGVSTIARLQDGCDYCGSRFAMSELFPKATEYHFITNYAKYLVSYWQNGLKVCLLLGLLCGIINAIINFTTPTDLAAVPAVLLGIFTFILSIVLGFFGAEMVFFLLLIPGLFIYIFIVLAILIPKDKQSETQLNGFVNHMRRHDPYFSGDEFLGKVISRTKMALYTDNISQLATCELDSLDPAFDNLVDMEYLNHISIPRASYDGPYVHVSTELEVSNTYYVHGSLKRKKEILKIDLCKNITNPVNLFFQIKAVKCPCCGSSFDTSIERNCPHCNNPFPARDEDWVITRISK